LTLGRLQVYTNRIAGSEATRIAGSEATVT
jgi:hypothetical protein